MKIGELAREAGTTPRLLRYYEAQGLLTPRRRDNTYRDYDERDLRDATRVVGLVRAGVPTRLVKVLLDLEQVPDDELVAACPRSVAVQLETELSGLDERIACLSRSRDTLRDFLSRAEQAAVALERDRSGGPGPALPPDGGTRERTGTS